jgi:hypothetical protein
MKKITIRVSEMVQARLGNTYKNLTSAGERVIEAWTIIRQDQLEQLKGIFARQELLYLIDFHNSLYFDAHMQSQPNVLIASIEDSASLDGLDAKWEVDAKVLADKMSKLNRTQCYFLSEWCKLYWEVHSHKTSFDNYVKELTAQP